MIKFLRFKTANGDRLLNVEACTIIKRFNVNEIHFEYVPTNTTGTLVVRKLERVPATGDSFDGELIGYIYDAIIKAAEGSYTQAIVDVDVPSKYALQDLINYP